MRLLQNEGHRREGSAEVELVCKVKTELKRLTLEAVDSIYVTALEDDDMGMADVELIDIIQHLDEEYGKITHDQLEANRNKLASAWDPDQPIEQLWKAVREIKRYAKAGGEERGENYAELRETLPGRK